MTVAENPPASSIDRLLRQRNFTLVSLACFVSFLGDQLSLVALPWLIMNLTDNPAVLGSVVALLGIPRALLILYGGAVVDRFSARKVILVTKSLCCLLLSGLAASLYYNVLTIGLLYLFTFAIGFASAFTLPATAAILPEVVRTHELHLANVVRLVLEKFALIIGPVVAGYIVAAYADRVFFYDGSWGVMLVFGLNAATFLAGAGLINAVNITAKARAKVSIYSGLKQGFAHFWRDKPLRGVILYVAAVNLLVAGPLHVGIPLLVKQHFAAEATAYGFFLGILYASMIVGMVLSATIKIQWALGTCVLVGDILSGLLLVLLSRQSDLGIAYGCLSLIGLLVGFLQVSLVSWVQRRIPGELQGRIMAIVQFAVLGVAPLASVLSGGILRWITVTQLFALGGAMLASVAVLALYGTDIRKIRND